MRKRLHDLNILKMLIGLLFGFAKSLACRIGLLFEYQETFGVAAICVDRLFNRESVA
jgi:hypothetical protein